MLRQVLLIFSLAVLLTTYLVSQVDGQNPWSPMPNCTTYRCDPALEEGFTLEQCQKKHGDRAKFYPDGSYCNCSICMKILRKGENCSELFIRDRAVFVVCDTDLACRYRGRTCE